jgi:hypothetical protein
MLHVIGPLDHGIGEIIFQNNFVLAEKIIRLWPIRWHDIQQPSYLRQLHEVIVSACELDQ